MKTEKNELPPSEEGTAFAQLQFSKRGKGRSSLRMAAAGLAFLGAAEATTTEAPSKQPIFEPPAGASLLQDSEDLGSLDGPGQALASQHFSTQHFSTQRFSELSSFKAMEVGTADEDSFSSKRLPKALANFFEKQDRVRAETVVAEMDPVHRKKFLTIFADQPFFARQHLLFLAEREDSFLMEKDLLGGRLLDHLYELSEGEMPPALEEYRSEVLRALLLELVAPGEINQGSIGTCNVMPINYDLAKNLPAEYARLIRGLLTEDGRVMLKGGVEMLRVEDSITNDDTGRSITERLLQSSMREMVSGPLLTYRNELRGDVIDGTDYMVTEGMSLIGTARVMDHIYGKDFHVYDRLFYSVEDMLTLLKANEFRYASVALDWDATGDGASDDRSGHTLAFVGIKDDRVYLRNSHVIWAKPGEILDAPTRRVENRTEGLVSMSLEDFKGQLCGVVVEESHFTKKSLGMYMSHWTPLKSALNIGLLWSSSMLLLSLFRSGLNGLKRIFRRGAHESQTENSN